MNNPFRYFNSSPEIIRLTVMMYIHYPLSLRQVEDLLFERGIDICHETVRFWWNRFGPMFAAEIRKRRVNHRSYSNWRWHLDEVFVRHCQSKFEYFARTSASYFARIDFVRFLRMDQSGSTATLSIQRFALTLPTTEKLRRLPQLPADRGSQRRLLGFIAR